MGMAVEPGVVILTTAPDNRGDDKDTKEHKVGYVAYYNKKIMETGKPVQVRFIQGGLEIQIMGISLQTGSAGDTVRIRNADSGTVFHGVVMADGTIKVSS